MKTARFLDRQSPPHIVTLVAIAGLSALTMNIFLPALPSMAKDFGVSYGTIQILISGYIAMTALIQLVIGPLSDRFGRRPTVLGSLCLLLVASLVCMLATDIYTLVAARMVQTAVVAGIVLSRAIVRDMVPMEQAASMIGYVTMGMTIVPMIGPTLGGVLGDAFGWRANFAALVLLAAVVLALVWTDLGETNHNRSASFSAQFRAWPGLLASTQFWGYSAVVTFTSGAFFAFLGGAPFVGATLLEMNPSTLGLQFVFIAAGYMMGNFLSGRYARRFGTFIMMLAGTLALILGTLVPMLLLLAGAKSALAFFGPQVIVGFGNGLTLPSANAGVVSVRPHLAGSASGLSGAISMGGGAASSLFASAILSVETGAMPLLLVMLTCGVLALAALLLLRYSDPTDSWRSEER
ncbi:MULTISPECIES: multidrug effflux MFS transporter [Alphaproteobacteria]|uniref:Bcr/CflA family efflux transporter n=2 Tax=Alphaproteobacteria TaxID=28211 RepID=A0A512HCC4_9HYPH|nr:MULTISPECIES: multidrug effflux MFS transporter [Alphaproteobacteria]GEO83106.1 Bcr/CflA family drug resistance efflux transporter [Ciceribacter naphthalenivorans]GLR20498.1 Bcr/CflA family drug resistance efflux transporter [Ciceribacter naphthalenivorans]GLT03354.1 Bcr/CflA family drug resistance efflux transporter [Sphingomonas psychrolutea]